jgi:serine/threonine protein kinase/predicted negative regulator of RcsB-dependent stress response
MLGETLSHYKILSEISRGGMGIVYRAVDLKLDREIALKVLPPELVTDPERKRRFIQEAKAAAKLEHPHIGVVHEIDEVDGVTFIAMELIQGEPLREMLRKEQPPLSRSLEIAAEVAEGLSFAHDKSLVHRDLKPANIMLTEQGHAKIIDFGLAKLVEPLAGEGSDVETAIRGETDPGKVLGTVSYMSPEQARGQSLDHRSDIFSFGIVLHEMFTGQPPFKGPTGADTLSAILHDPVPRLPAMGSGVSSEVAFDLQRIVDKCLARDPGKRYQTMRDLVVDLRTTWRNLESGTTATVVSRTVPKHWMVASAAGILILVLLAWLVFKPSPAPSPKAAATSDSNPSIAVMYFENLSGEPDLEKILVNMLTTNLSRYERIDVVSSQRLFDILKLIGKQDVDVIDRSVATEVATRADVETMLLGSIVKLGERFRISAQLLDVESGNNIGAGQVEGTQVEDMFEMTDQLTADVAAMLEIPTAELSGQAPKITDVTTSSFEAYRFYQRGLENQYRWNFSEAEEDFERAVEIDPTFAMAHAQLAITSGAFILRNPLADLSPMRERLRLAKEYSAKATDLEQHLIDLGQALFNRDFNAASNLGTDLVERYPKEKIGHNWLTFAFIALGSFERAIQSCERLLELDPTYANVYNNLAYSYARSRDYPKAISTIKKYIALQPEVGNPYSSAWDVYMMAGQFDEAYRICNEALSKNPYWYELREKVAYTDLVGGRIEKARERLRQLSLLDPGEMWQMWVARDLGYFHIYEGRYREALTEFEKAVEPASRISGSMQRIITDMEMAKVLALRGDYPEALKTLLEVKDFSTSLYPSSSNPVLLMADYLEGSTLAQKGDLGEAQQRADTIKRFVENDSYDRYYLDFYNMLVAQINLARGDAQAATAALSKVSNTTKVFSPRCASLIADVATLQGDTGTALSTYERYCNRIDKRQYLLGGDHFDFFLGCSRVNYRLGQIYEQAGDQEQAIDYYTKALEQWKNADEDFPELIEVKAGLERLNARP